MLAATMAEFSISSRAKKTKTAASGMLAACVARGVNAPRWELAIWESGGTADGAQ